MKSSIMLLFHSVVIAQGLSIAVSAESNAWRNTTTATSATSTSRSLPLNIKPPLPLGNGSTYSILPSTGTIPATFSATATRNASITASANLATYGNYTFSTICPSGNSGCMSSCQAFANSCHKEFDAWSTARNSFQSSIVDESNSGVMPVTNSYYVITGTPSTSYEYNTSWIMNRWTSSLPGWAAADNGYTTITHELITASDVKATASDPSTYGDAVNGDTALVAFGSTTWTASKVSQGVQLSPGVVLATDSTMTTAGKTIWLAAGDGIVVASGTSRTTIGFKSASDQHPSTAGPTGKQSRTSAVTTSATSSVETASQGDCPYWTTCISESTVGTIVDAATATATGGAQTLICRTAWSLTAALCSIVASWLV
ncbi:hypothetical protein HII31_08794 [Pseudocercospora fuligena]|uniref:Uncharacterized protein n=1 Tax=Pseudocercospora fuligena TaxID=685502 RepID=A0A8H6VGS6_9PEZI|nr:hypothetical protein HII31_08794 [Pseudocercospora fuligena]